ncbi:Conserved_hypothetical protein [Hexamita inflata]|uniref:Uncharacterized protein n=1 Tax=Hexamita inflata TaxID=28002 RepID=A0ABP1GGS4_9EUKA
MSIFTYNNGQLILNRYLIKTSSNRFFPPEYLIGQLIMTHQPQTDKEVLQVDINGPYVLANYLQLKPDQIVRGQPADDYRQFSRMSQQLNSRFSVASYKSQPVQLEQLLFSDILLFLSIYGCSVTFTDQFVLRIPEQTVSPVAPTTLLQHLLQQSYYQSEFEEEQLLADLYLSGYLFSHFKPTTQQYTNEQCTQIRATNVQILSLNNRVIQNALNFIKNLPLRQEEFNLVQHKNKLQVNPPYNIRNLSELEEKLQKFTIKRSKLVQFKAEEPFLENILPSFHFPKQTEFNFKNSESFKIDEEEFHQIRPKFKFAPTSFSETIREINIPDEVRQQLQELGSQNFQRGETAKVERISVAREDKKSSKDQWQNIHMVDDAWYKEKMPKGISK